MDSKSSAIRKGLSNLQSVVADFRSQMLIASSARDMLYHVSDGVSKDVFPCVVALTLVKSDRVPVGENFS